MGRKAASAVQSGACKAEPVCSLSMVLGVPSSLGWSLAPGQLPNLQHAAWSCFFHFCGFICMGGMGFAALTSDRVFK